MKKIRGTYEKLQDKLAMIFVVLAILVLLLFVWHYFIEWQYHAELLMSPCQLCAKVTPSLESCIYGVKTQIITNLSNFTFVP